MPTIKHKKTSAKADAANAALVRPSDWNNTHDMLTVAGSVYLGQNATGAGPILELPITATSGDDYTMWTKAAAQAALTAAITPLLEGPRTNVASASTCDIGAVATHYVNITGTVTINSFGTANSGVWRRVIFADILTLTNSAAIILPGAANIVTAIGDTAVFVSNGANVWVCFGYQRASGALLIVPPGVRVGGGYAANVSSSTLTAFIAKNDTIPQVNQGTEVLSVTITPKTLTNRVRVRAVVPLGAPAGVQGVACVSLFRNAAVNAISSTYVRIVDGFGTYPGIIEFEDSPAAITAQVYSVRAGGDTFNVLLNSDTSGRMGGGTSKATLTLDEFSG